MPINRDIEPDIDFNEQIQRRSTWNGNDGTLESMREDENEMQFVKDI